MELINEHRSTLIFVNTRKLAERVAHQLTERLGEDQVLAHHGSLAHRSRQRTEQRLKEGSLKAVVATASLELGIDVGHIDLVCQLGTPRSIATFLQRVGRAGHSLGLVPKGRLFALSRDELIECLALVRAVDEAGSTASRSPRRRWTFWPSRSSPRSPATTGTRTSCSSLSAGRTRYRDLSRDDYEAVLDMLSEGIAPERGRFGAYLHRDRVNRRLHARKGAAHRHHLRRRDPGDRRLPRRHRRREPHRRRHASTRTSPSRATAATSSCWATPRGGSSTSAAAKSSCSTPTGRRRPFPSGCGEAPGRTLELSAEVGRPARGPGRARMSARVRPSRRGSSIG